jgi:hypothetical protein
VPRFYFDLIIEGHRFTDHVGLELVNLEAALEHARTDISELLTTQMGKALVSAKCAIEVSNESRRRLSRVPFAMLSGLAPAA